MERQGGLEDEGRERIAVGDKAGCVCLETLQYSDNKLLSGWIWTFPFCLSSGTTVIRVSMKPTSLGLTAVIIHACLRWWHGGLHHTGKGGFGIVNWWGKKKRQAVLELGCWSLWRSLLVYSFDSFNACRLGAQVLEGNKTLHQDRYCMANYTINSIFP